MGHAVGDDVDVGSFLRRWQVETKLRRVRLRLLPDASGRGFVFGGCVWRHTETNAHDGGC